MHGIRDPGIDLLDILEPSANIKHSTFPNGRISDLVTSQSTPQEKISDCEAVTYDMGSERQVRVKLEYGFFDRLKVGAVKGWQTA